MNGLTYHEHPTLTKHFKGSDINRGGLVYSSQRRSDKLFFIKRLKSNQMKHTQGNWKAQANSSYMEVNCEASDEKKMCISIMLYENYGNEKPLESINLSEESRANADVIAAAPELLECLLNIIDAQNNPKRSLASLNGAIKNSEQAIKKATP